jgi:hypothetical protein
LSSRRPCLTSKGGTSRCRSHQPPPARCR